MASPAIMERVPSIVSFSPPKQNYDVYISHRAKDTGSGFAADLHKALTAQGIVVYRDENENENEGKMLTEKLTAIEESRSSIVVFSENYGDLVSMKELAKIGMYKEVRDQLVLPIFYQIDPAHVRKQKGNFEKPFIEHEENVGFEEVQSWRDSMFEVGNLSGWHLQEQQ